MGVYCSTSSHLSSMIRKARSTGTFVNNDVTSNEMNDSLCSNLTTDNFSTNSKEFTLHTLILVRFVSILATKTEISYDGATMILTGTPSLWIYRGSYFYKIFTEKGTKSSVFSSSKIPKKKN